MVNYLSIIFPIVRVIVMITALISKSEVVKRIAFIIFIIGALVAIAAITTGEGAEDVVENINGVSENYEETAETYALLSYILGGISLFGLWASFNQKSFSFYFFNCNINFRICGGILC